MLEINRVYNENCLTGMKLIDDKSIDLVVTDPPYKVTSRGSIGKTASKKPSGILSRKDGKMFEQNNIKISDWMPEIFRILKDDSHCYVFTNVLTLNEMINESSKAGFKLHNLLVWEKNNCTPSQFYMKNCEYILFLRKGKAKWINDIGGSKTVHKFNNIIGNKSHPCEKPVNLLEMYIKNSSNENDIVFDPFMGTGSLAIAAINTNRNYIGFELDENYYNLATDRINKHIFNQPK